MWLKGLKEDGKLVMALHKKFMKDWFVTLVDEFKTKHGVGTEVKEYCVSGKPIGARVHVPARTIDGIDLESHYFQIEMVFQRGSGLRRLYGVESTMVFPETTAHASLEILLGVMDPRELKTAHELGLRLCSGTVATGVNGYDEYVRNKTSAALAEGKENEQLLKSRHFMTKGAQVGVEV